MVYGIMGAQEMINDTIPAIVEGKNVYLSITRAGSCFTLCRHSSEEHRSQGRAAYVLTQPLPFPRCGMWTSLILGFLMYKWGW